MKTKRLSLSLLAFAALCAPLLQASPVKIFILAGQSNMVGKGQISPATTPGTVDYTVANDTAGQYSFLKAGGANYVVRNDVWIRNTNGSTGGLTVGYGDGSARIGAELGFGHRIGDLNEDRVLIVKVAKGGKSLGNDFLPPSSGPYATPVNDGDTGYWYAEILREVNDAITNLATYVPGYLPSDGYEIVGFGWHQGWNDRISAPFSAAYETNMANFIRDMRSDLSVPGLPFVIATTAMDPETTYTQVELAQLAVANYPEFAGNVATIDCRSTYDGMVFWQRAGRSPRDESYHWNFNAKTYLNIGLSMGDAMSLMAPGRCPFRLKASGAPGGGVSLVWKNGTETPDSVRILRNGSEIAAAAPGSTTTFLDSAALPGSHTYQLEFTMPVTACPPLTTTFNGGVTGLALSRTTGDFVLRWNNNMAYTGIEIRRDGTLLGSPLSGTATTFTDPSPPATGNVTYTVTPTNGTPTPASVTTNLDLRGQLNVLDVATANGGINPTTGNPWQAGDQYRLIFTSKSTSSAASTDIATYNTFVQNVATAAGLGAATWKVLGSTQTVAARDNTGTNTGIAVGVPVILMDGTTVFADNNNDLWGGANSNGSGGTVTPIYHEDGTLIAANSRVWTGTNSNGTIANQFLGYAGNVGFGAPINSGATQWILVYGANNATTYPLYALSDPLTIQAGPDTTPPTVVSIADNKSGGPILASDKVTYTVTFSEPMNASTVDVTDFENGGAPPATIQSVSPTGDPAVFLVNVIPGGAGTLKLQVAAAAVLQDQSNLALVTNPVVADDTIITVNADSIPPSPNPMSWASPPSAGGSSITMTATAAIDPSGVEYFFEETSGNPGATDSGWQTSPTYTDTGLDPGTTYSYKVKARDLSTNLNETGWSSPDSPATTAAVDNTAPPTPTFQTPPAALSPTQIAMTATAVSDPSGVEYFFTCLTPGGHNSGWQSSRTYTDTGLSPETSYSYTVTARDQSANHNASAPSASASATTLPPPSGPGGAVIYEPFADSDSTLTGNTPGTGLAGTWATSGTAWNVAGPSLGYGSLPTPGNRASNVARGAHSITTGTVGSNTLLDAGLLNHGQTLWFSFLWKMDDSAVSNGDAAFVLGTHTLTGGANNGMPMTPAGTGSGIGVSMSTSNGTLTAGSWTSGTRAAGTPSAAWGNRSVAKLIVGKIIWGADASANDTITIYLPGADLALPLAPVSSKTAVLDQSLFNTITFATKTEGDPQIDEIRFGATYDDAVGMGGAGNSYTNWVDLFLPDVIGGLTLDFDGDGQSNGVENFFGTAPNAFSQGLVADTLNGNQFSFTHPQGVLADDLTATYKWSKDLVDFYPEGPGDGTTVDFATLTNTPSEGFTTVTATVTGAATGKLFLIVEVTQAP